MKSTGGSRAEVDIKELENAEKQLAFSENEYATLSTRLEKVSNPQYTFELKERTLALDERIKHLGKGQKKMEVAQLHREKRIHQVVAVGEPETLQDIQHAKSEYTTAEGRIQDLEAGLERGAGMIQDYNKKMGELSALFRKLEAEAVELGIDPTVISRKGKTNPLEERMKQLEQTKAYLLKDTNLIKTRHHVSLFDFVSGKAVLQKRLSDVAEKIQKKNEYSYFVYQSSIWINHMGELTELAEKLKGEYSDVVEQAVKRWQSMHARGLAAPSDRNVSEALRSDRGLYLPWDYIR